MTAVLVRSWYIDLHTEVRQNGQYFEDGIFKCIFLNENTWNAVWYLIEFCSLGLNQQYSSIGSDNGLASTREEAIILINDSQW